MDQIPVKCEGKPDVPGPNPNAANWRHTCGYAHTIDEFSQQRTCSNDCLSQPSTNCEKWHTNKETFQELFERLKV